MNRGQGIGADNIYKPSTNHIESPVRASRLLRSLQDEITYDAALSITPQNSKLAKYNRLKAITYLHEGDVGLAEKHLVLSFGYMKASFDEALQIHNRELKQDVMPKIAMEHRRIVFLFALTKLSYHTSISLPLIKDITTALDAVSIQNLSGSREDKLLIVSLALAQYIKRTKLDFVNEKDIIELIEDRVINSAIFDADEYRSLQWLVIRIYQAVVKSRRKRAALEPDTALQLALYRELSAKQLLELKEKTHAIDDLCESYLFRALSISKISELSTQVLSFKKDIYKAIKAFPYKQKYLEAIIVRMYIHGFNIATKLQDRTEYINLAYSLSKSIGRSDKIIELAPYYYLNSFMNKLQSSQNELSTSTIENDRDEFNGEIASSKGIVLTSDTNYMIALYYSAVSIYVGDNYYSCGLQTLDSINTLRDNKLIDTTQTKRLLLRALSLQVNIAPEAFELQDSEDKNQVEAENLQTLNTLLRNEESVDIEVKLSDSTLDKIVQTICSFSNTKGGKIIVGLIERAYFSEKYPDKDISSYTVIANSFVLIGSKSFDGLRTKLSSKIKSKVRIIGMNKQTDDLYTIALLSVGGKQVMVIDVAPHFASQRVVCAYQGAIYTRHDNQNLEISASELAEKIIYASAAS